MRGDGFDLLALVTFLAGIQNFLTFMKFSLGHEGKAERGPVLNVLMQAQG